MSKYKKNYLTRVAVRIEFPEISGITEDESSFTLTKDYLEKQKSVLEAKRSGKDVNQYRENPDR